MFGIFKSSPPTLTDGVQAQPRLDATGAMVVSGGGSSSSPSVTTVQNTQASQAQTAGYPAVNIYAKDSANVDSLIGVYSVPVLLPATTDRSGTAGTTSATLAAANTSRRGLNIQNISANNLGINEQGGTAAIGTAGTYTLAAGASLNVRSNKAITVIASAASSAYTATEF